MIGFKLKEVTFLLILGAALNAAQYQRNPQQVQGEYVGFLSNGRCLKEVNTADLYLVGLSEHQAQRGSRPGTSIIQTCCENFVQDLSDPNRCIAAGTVYPPNTQTTRCSFSQVLNEQNQCVDICPWGCPNGLCNGATCICNHGYRLDQTGKYCAAHCDTPCGRNSYCQVPGRCACLPGYTLDRRMVCEPQSYGGVSTRGGGVSTGGLYPTLPPHENVYPTPAPAGNCPNGCYNGVCNQYGQCTCPPGFHFNQWGNGCERQTQCRGCSRGTCVAPNQCVCPPGLYLQGDDCVSSSSQYPSQSSQCRGCFRGNCVGPNQCVCSSGFVLQGDDCVSSSSTYQPSQIQQGYSQCRGCVRGTCVGPNQCICPSGSMLLGDDCVSTSSTYQPGFGGQTQQAAYGQCQPDCFNGQCVGPNQCQCYPGYIKDPVHQHLCTPYCPKGCPNGSCSSPDFCVCNQGYRKVNGACQRY